MFDSFIIKPLQTFKIYPAPEDSAFGISPVAFGERLLLFYPFFIYFSFFFLKKIKIKRWVAYPSQLSLDQILREEGGDPCPDLDSTTEGAESSLTNIAMDAGWAFFSEVASLSQYGAKKVIFFSKSASHPFCFELSSILPFITEKN